jgi:integrase
MPASTQEKYQIRAFQLIARAKKESGQVQLTATQIAHWLIDKKDGYSKSTWRQYRASLVFGFAQYFQSSTGNVDDCSAAIVMLRQAASPQGRPEHRKTSAQKQKKVNNTDLFRLMDYFNAKPPHYGLATQAWLLAGIWTGLRPCEWESAEVNEANELLVTNAKATEGRAHGYTRIIDLTDLSDQEKQIIDLHLKHVQQAKLSPWHKEKSGFEQFYSRCRSRLYVTTRALWPKRKQHITLYSSRHQFAANAKFHGLPLEEIAALMGHASIETAMTHYGRRSAGNGSMRVKAHNDDVARVTELNQHRLDHGRGMGM